MRYSMPGWQRWPVHGRYPIMLSGLMGIVALWFAAAELQPETSQVRTVTIEQRVILKVPVNPRPVRSTRWDERRGPQCVPVQMIRGAFLAGDESIDFLLRGQQRVRAQLDKECGGLDFYGGFYMQPEGAQICAKRDLIRTRMGGSCQIRRFRSLVPRYDRR